MSVTSAERGAKSKEMGQQTSAAIENNSSMVEEQYKDPLMMTFTLGNEEGGLRKSNNQRESLIISETVTLSPTNFKGNEVSPDFNRDSNKLKGDKILLLEQQQRRGSSFKQRYSVDLSPKEEDRGEVVIQNNEVSSFLESFDNSPHRLNAKGSQLFVVPEKERVRKPKRPASLA